MEPSLKTINRKRYSYLGIATIAMLVLGLFYAWSIFAVPLHDEYQWDQGRLQLIFTFSMVFLSINCLVSSYVAKAIGSNKTVALAGLLLLVGYLGTAFFASRSLLGIFIFYGIVCSSGCGFGYITILAQVNRWFPDRIGLSSGVMLMGFGLGGLIFGTIAGFLIDHIGVSAILVIIGIVGLVICLLLALFLRAAPEDIIAILNAASPSKEISSDAPEGDKSPVRSLLFWIYIVWSNLIICIGLSFIGSAKQGALVLGISPALATLIVGFVSTTNGLTRVLAGLINDRWGLKTVFFMDAFLTFAAAALILISFATGSKPLYVVAAIVTGLSYGQGPVISSAYVREQYGDANYQRNLAIVLIALIPAPLLSSGFTALFGIDGTCTNTSFWIAMTVLAVITVAIAFLFFALRKRMGLDSVGRGGTGEAPAGHVGMGAAPTVRADVGVAPTEHASADEAPAESADTHADS